MKKKSIGIIAVSVLCAFAIFAGAMFAHQYFDAKNSEDSFDVLTNLIVDVPDETVPETDNSESTELSPEELAAQEAEQARAKYKELFEKNDDEAEYNKSKNRNVLDVRASLKVGLQMEQGKLPSH